MKKRLHLLGKFAIVAILVISFASFSLPAKAGTFVDSFIADCEGETWFVDFVKAELAKSGLTLSSNASSIQTALGKITDLSAEYSSATKIPKSVKYLTNLKSVNLSYNNLTSISPLSSCTKLETLILDGNFISDCTLSQFTELTKLSMAYNSFRTMPTLSSNTKLTYIDFTGNDISKPTSLSALKNLCYVNLSKNSISDASTLGTFTMAIAADGATLDLSYNLISDAKFMANITRAVNVDLSHNLISSNVDKIKTTVKVLNLSDNKLSDASALSALTLLEELNISNNSFSNINPLKTLTSLKALDASHNNIADVTELGYLTQLEILDLSYNKLADMPFHSLLRNLRIFNISGNQITNIALINRYVNIEQVYASDNKIEDISSISGMENLTVADFSNNLVTDVNSELYKTTRSLEIIKLSGNALTKDGVKNLLANGYSEIWLENIDLTDKIPDMSAYSDISELYVSGSTLGTADVSNLFKKTDYTGLGLGGLITDSVIEKLKTQYSLVKLDVSSKALSASYAEKLSSLDIFILDMSNCSLTSVDKILSTTDIMSLDLSGNKIVTVSESALQTAKANCITADLSNNAISSGFYYLYYDSNGFDFDNNYLETNAVYTLTYTGSATETDVGKSINTSDYVTATNRYTGKTVALPSQCIDVTVIAGIATKVQISDYNKVKVLELIYPYENYTVRLTSSIKRAFAGNLIISTDLFPLQEIEIGSVTGISGIDVGMTFDEVFTKLKLSDKYTYKAFNKDGQQIPTTSTVGTGMVLKVYADGKEVLARTVIVYGDINGDGNIDDIDFVVLKRHLYGQKKLTGAYLISADVKHSGTVDSNDFMLLMQSILIKTAISQR